MVKKVIRFYLQPCKKFFFPSVHSFVWQLTLKNMLRGTDYGNSAPSDDVIRKFEQWITNQYRQALRPMPYASPLAQFPFPMGSPSSLHHDKGHIGSSDDRVHPALQVSCGLKCPCWITYFDIYFF